MSDGVGESGRENEHNGGGIRKKQQGGSDEYGRAITKIAVAQICESVGFQNFQQSTLDVLSEVTIRYLRDLGKTAHFYANLGGRTDCNAFDVIQGLEDLVTLQGFSGASDVKRSLASSGTVKEIMQYVSSDEIQFARDVTHFPVIKDRKPTPSFLQIGETPDKEHIPAWLPAFPDPHTYVHTPVWNERTTDPRADKIEQARQRRKEERSLFSLQQRLACNGSSAFASMNSGDHAKEKAGSESNPFLAPPLQSGEKDVSPIVPPAKLSNEPVVISRSSVLETFAPAMGVADTGLCDSRDDDRKVLPNKRPIVNFKLGVSKKSLSVPFDLTLQNKSLGETAHLIVRSDAKDEKKRRAEQILKDSMDNSRELS
ncbi:Transcription initiation factor tfiid subunit [Thalictrum thalictroides]|uniref:Transcription initiation factor TFIID subunit 8 n=1 Tax=Thalictrum thalictroides TaxID=46969 RepID=A0A7J6V549_THATH|nr:Transcription initiation factor tfiid subunit [Thalictrum thalictroides]